MPSPATRELVEQIRADETTPQPVAPLRRPIRLPPARVANPRRRRAAERTTGTVTLLFTDQVGSTETLQSLGDEEGERLRRAHFGLLREAAAMHGGEEVKNLGDGLMVAFLSAVDAVACAITIQQAVRRAGASGELAFAVRIGMNVGEPIRDEGDYFGTPVVIAKRLCDAGAPGQILASELVRALVGTRGGFSYRPLDPFTLKGVAEPVAACEVVWEPSSEQRVPLPALLAGGDSGAFVGRSDATATLEAAWGTVRERRLPRRDARGRARDRQDAPGEGVRPRRPRAGRDGAGGQLPRAHARPLPAVRRGAAPLHRLLPPRRAGRAGHAPARAARRDRAGAGGCARPLRAERPRRRAGALPPVRGSLRAAGRRRARPPDGVVPGRPALGRSAEPAAASPPCQLRAGHTVDGSRQLPACRGRRRAPARRGAG